MRSQNQTKRYLMNEWNGKNFENSKCGNIFHRRTKNIHSSTKELRCELWLQTTERDLAYAIAIDMFIIHIIFQNSNEFAQNDRVRPFVALNYTKFKRTLEIRWKSGNCGNRREIWIKSIINNDTCYRLQRIGIIC